MTSRSQGRHTYFGRAVLLAGLALAFALCTVATAGPADAMAAPVPMTVTEPIAGPVTEPVTDPMAAAVDLADAVPRPLAVTAFATLTWVEPVNQLAAPRPVAWLRSAQGHEPQPRAAPPHPVVSQVVPAPAVPVRYELHE